LLTNCREPAANRLHTVCLTRLSYPGFTAAAQQIAGKVERHPGKFPLPLAQMGGLTLKTLTQINISCPHTP
jgi:hypothetical protein